MEVLVLLALIALNGVFAMSEIALVTARRARLAKLGEGGDASAALALRLHDDPTRFLSTVQIGITSIGVLNGIVGEAALAAPLAAWLGGLGVDEEVASVASTALVVVGITYTSIVIGELVPKRVGQLNPEGIARFVARPMHILSVVARPFVRLLSASTDLSLRLLGQRERAGQGVTEDEIHAVLEEGTATGVIERDEHDMVRNVLRLDDRQVVSLMVPRSDIEHIDLTSDDAAIVTMISGSERSRFPVCRGGFQEIVGIVDARQLLRRALLGEPLDVASRMAPPVFVPETLTGKDLLAHFRASGAHMVLVVDEYGELQGLVTLHDVLEIITGELEPPTVEEAWAVRRDDGSWLIDGLIPIPELKERLGLRALPEEERGRYHTLGGLVMWLMGRIPHTGDITTLDGWRLEVVDLDGQRVDKVLASRIAAPMDEAARAEEPPTKGD